MSETGSVVAAVEREVAAIRLVAPAVADGALAATALVLAAELDSPGTSASSRAQAAKVLLDTLDRLKAAAPSDQAGDWLDDLAARRAARVAGRPGA